MTEVGYYCLFGGPVVIMVGILMTVIGAMIVGPM